MFHGLLTMFTNFQTAIWLSFYPLVCEQIQGNVGNSTMLCMQHLLTIKTIQKIIRNHLGVTDCHFLWITVYKDQCAKFWYKPEQCHHIYQRKQPSGRVAWLTGPPRKAPPPRCHQSATSDSGQTPYVAVRGSQRGNKWSEHDCGLHAYPSCNT